jgi:chaperonin GroEL (HSP60 family)
VVLFCVGAAFEEEMKEDRVDDALHATRAAVEILLLVVVSL